MSGWSDEETRDPLYADDRMFFKVEQWTRDGMHVERLLYAGNNLAQYAGAAQRAKLPTTVANFDPDTVAMLGAAFDKTV